VIGGHIIKPLTFLELVRILNSSVPCQGLLFLNSPPLLFSINLLSIRLPSRVSVKLEESSPLSAFAILIGVQANHDKLIVKRMALSAKVGEWCVSPTVIFPKCEFLSLEKFAIVRFQRLREIACCPLSRFYHTDQTATN